MVILRGNRHDLSERKGKGKKVSGGERDWSLYGGEVVVKSMRQSRNPGASEGRFKEKTCKQLSRKKRNSEIPKCKMG